MTCYICLKRLKPHPDDKRVCPDAPLICAECRANPEALSIARLATKIHLDDHRARGDFRGLMSNAWRDPVRRTA